ncbi:MAG: hypothetical protein ACOYN6_13530 [Ignavibacteria bacterium]
MIKKVLLIISAVFVLLVSGSSAQDTNFTHRKTSKYLTWSLLQLIPSPTLVSDANNDNARVQFGLKWQIIPVNFSFRANKFVSPVQFFVINPVRRVTGSAELFVQPEIVTSGFKYSGFNSFGVTTGGRLVIPVQELGENISASVGANYTFRKNDITGESGYTGIEAGVYFFGGMMGFQFVKNFNNNNKFSVSLYLKYF